MRIKNFARLFMFLCLMGGLTLNAQAQDNLRQTLFEEAKDALAVQRVDHLNWVAQHDDDAGKSKSKQTRK